MRSFISRTLPALAILAFCPILSFGQAAGAPLTDRELIALVAGNSLSENIVHEISTRGLAFRPRDQFRLLLTEAGADSKVLAALDSAKASDPIAPTESSDKVRLLQNLADAGKFIHNKNQRAAEAVFNR